MDTLFRTIHGSHLYGLSNANSDRDYYTVVDKPQAYRVGAKARYAKQTIVDDEDSLVVDFGTWLQMCNNGVPQALEAMFSSQAEYDQIAEFRAGFRAGTQTWDRYLRTIKSFALGDTDPYKRKRHALRLALNLRELMETGRFEPTLSFANAQLITELAHNTKKRVYEMALDIVWR